MKLLLLAALSFAADWNALLNEARAQGDRTLSALK